MSDYWSAAKLGRLWASQLLHAGSDVFICYLTVKTSGWLHVTAFKGGGYYKWDLTKALDRCSPVVDYKQVVVVKIADRISWICSIKALPFEHDRGIMGSLQTPVLLHRVEAGNVVIP